MVLGARVSIEAGELDRAQRMLASAEALGANPRDVASLRALVTERRR